MSGDPDSRARRRVESEDFGRYALLILLFVAALVEFVHLHGERRRDAATRKAERLKDLDESRRVLYIAYFTTFPGVTPDRRVEAAGTLINALRHHSGLLKQQAGAYELGDQIMATDTRDAKQRLRQLIDEVTRLESLGLTRPRSDNDRSVTS